MSDIAPGPDHEHHHHHAHTGRRWLDIVLGVSAIAISVISLFVAVHHGQTMEKMVEANTWPYLDFAASNLDPQGASAVSFIVLNSGVGPAKIEGVELTYDGQPLKDGGDLLRRCCVPKGIPVQYMSATVVDRVLPAGETLVLFAIRPEGLPAGAFETLNAARPKVEAKICYCSALDRCWIRDTTKRRPAEVDSCPVPKVAFGGA